MQFFGGSSPFGGGGGGGADDLFGSLFGGMPGTIAFAYSLCTGADLCFPMTGRLQANQRPNPASEGILKRQPVSMGSATQQ